ncbi:hypothetical protein BC829DRAFT_493594 [Chytridium lagenaria]|nr:hypothetical protein BC829DRAFT_493594 [Chytridium lagenaria]
MTITSNNILTPPNTSRSKRDGPEGSSSPYGRGVEGLPSAPKYFNDTIFKIKAFDGYIASEPDHVSFRKGQFFYALSYNEETQCYFVSTQYATPFARTAVCGFVPERYFETVSLNGKDAPHPTPAQYKKSMNDDFGRRTPDSYKQGKSAAAGNDERAATLGRLRSSKSVGYLRDRDAKEEEEELEREEQGSSGRQEVAAVQAAQAQAAKENKGGRGRSISMRTLRRRGKSNPPLPGMIADEDVTGGAQESRGREQSAGGNNIVIPPRRTFIPNLLSTTSTSGNNVSGKPGSSSKKKQTPKAFQTLDKSFRLFNFSSWADRPPQTSKTPGAPTTAAATSTHLRHETPYQQASPLPPMPTGYVEVVKQQQQQQHQQQQHQQQLPFPSQSQNAAAMHIATLRRPSTPTNESFSATVVEALKQSGPINLTRFVIALSMRPSASAHPSSATPTQRITTITKTYEELAQFHASLSSRLSHAAQLRRPSNETGFYAATRTPPDSPSTHGLPDFPAPINNVAELRRRFLLDARLQSQMTDLNTYMVQIFRTQGGAARAMEQFLLSSPTTSPGGLDEGISLGNGFSTPPPRANTPEERMEDQYQSQGLMNRSRMRSKSEAPFLNKEAPSTTSGTGGIFSGFSTLRRSKSRTRDLKGDVGNDGMGAGEMGSGNTLNKIMTVLRNGGGNAPTHNQPSANPQRPVYGATEDSYTGLHAPTPHHARTASAVTTSGNPPHPRPNTSTPPPNFPQRGMTPNGSIPPPNVSTSGSSRIGMGGLKTPTNPSFYPSPSPYRSNGINQGGMDQVMAGMDTKDTPYHRSTPQPPLRASSVFQNHQPMYSPTPSDDHQVSPASSDDVAPPPPTHLFSSNAPPPPPHIPSNNTPQPNGWNKMLTRLGVSSEPSSVSIRQRSTSLGWDASAGGMPNNTAMLQQQQQQQQQQIGTGASATYPDKATVKMMMMAAAAQGNAVGAAGAVGIGMGGSGAPVGRRKTGGGVGGGR